MHNVFHLKNDRAYFKQHILSAGLSMEKDMCEKVSQENISPEGLE